MPKQCHCSLSSDPHTFDDAVAHRAARIKHEMDVNALANTLTAMTLSDDPIDPDPVNHPPDLSQGEVLTAMQAVLDASPPQPPSESSELGSWAMKAMSKLDFFESRIQEINASLNTSCSLNELPRILETATQDLEALRLQIVSQANDDIRVVARRKAILHLLYQSRERVSSLWLECGDAAGLQPQLYDSAYLFDDHTKHLSPIAQLISLVGLITHCFTRTSLVFCNFLIGAMIILAKSSVRLGLGPQSHGLNPVQEHVLDQIPTSINQAIKQFHLDGKVIIHAVCPTCKFVHKPIIDPETGAETWPANCQGPKPKQLDLTCDEQLLNKSGKPKVPYLVPSFNDYVARLLSDPAIEEQCKRAADAAVAGFTDPPPFSDDAFSGTFQSSFKDRNGQPFLDRKDKIKLAFTIHYDQFDPKGVTPRGDSSSVGMITLSLLNLDLKQRNDPEHLYLALIPGPDTPCGHQLNYFLKPVIDQLLVAWERGVQLTRTAQSLAGMIFEIAISHAIGDLLAARHMAGFAGPNSSHLCICGLEGRQEVYNTDWDTWPTRDVEEMRKTAYSWLHAQTVEEREEIYQSTGIRWSELWRLPYWNPVKMLVVDPMHCLLEGLCKYHVQYLLKLSDAKESSKPKAFEHDWEDYNPYDPEAGYELTEKQAEKIPGIQKLLEHPIDENFTFEVLKARLSDKNAHALKFVARSLGLAERLRSGGSKVWLLKDARVTEPTRAAFAELLVSWRRGQPLRPDPTPSSASILSHVQNVIRNTATPSWLGSVPHNFGQKSAGTIKADEWRIMAVVYLPIALVTLWGDIGSPMLSVLDHTMSLFQAVAIAMRYTMTPQLATTYRNYIKYWVDNLRKVYPSVEKQRRTRTNIHVAFHIYDSLILFGPVVSWWAFPFERLVGVLQKIPTNDWIGGQMEATIIKSFMRGANLRRWLRREDCPEIIRQLKILFNKTFPPLKPSTPQPNPPRRTSRRTKTSATHYTVDDDFGSARITYSIASTHRGNSSIFYRREGSSELVAGEISQIDISGAKPRFIVRRRLSLPQGARDPFKRFPYIHATTFSTSFSAVPDHITLDDIVSHGAAFDFTKERVVVLKLSR